MVLPNHSHHEDSPPASLGDWDDAVPEDIEDTWRRWRSELSDLSLLLEGGVKIRKEEEEEGERDVIWEDKSLQLRRFRKLHEEKATKCSSQQV